MSSNTIAIPWEIHTEQKIAAIRYDVSDSIVYAVQLAPADRPTPKRGLTKIGHGSFKRLKELLSDIKACGHGILKVAFADLAGAPVKSRELEQYLHRVFADKRYAQTNEFGFIGGTEVFKVAVATVVKIRQAAEEEIAKMYASVSCEPDVSLDAELAEQGYAFGPSIRIQTIEKPSDERFKNCDFSFEAYQSPVAATAKNALQRVDISWFKNAGDDPFEHYGSPNKGTTEYEKTVATIKHKEANVSTYLSQFAFPRESAVIFIDYLEAYGSISLEDLVRFFARYGVVATKDVEVGLPPKLQKIFDDEVEFFKTHGKYDSATEIFDRGIVHLTGKARVAYESVLDLLYTFSGYDHYVDKLYDRQLDCAFEMFDTDAEFMRRDARKKCDEDYVSGFYYKNLHAGIHCFDLTYPIQVKCEGIRHIADLLLNPLSRYPTVTFCSGDHALVCEAFAVAPIAIVLKFLESTENLDELMEEYARKIWDYVIERHGSNPCEDGGFPEPGSGGWNEQRHCLEAMVNCECDDHREFIRLWPGSGDLLLAMYKARH